MSFFRNFSVVHLGIIFFVFILVKWGFPGGLAVKKPPANVGYNAGDKGLIPGLGRSPGGGNGNPLQYSFLKKKNPINKGARQATVLGYTNGQTGLSSHACILIILSMPISDFHEV